MEQSNETEALKKDIEQLKRDLRALTESVKHSSQARAQAGLDSARHKYDEIKREADNYTQDIGSEIEARPFTSVLAAFGIGLVLGKLIGR